VLGLTTAETASGEVTLHNFLDFADFEKAYNWFHTPPRLGK
jgi:hypothetical protein